MSVGTVARQRRMARQGRLRAQVPPFTLRRERISQVSTDCDMHVRYPRLVPAREREIDREAWSRVVLELLESEADGNRTELARLIGVKYLTVARWIAGTHAVSEESVRAVARAFNLSAIDLLIKVGYWTSDELTANLDRAPVSDRTPTPKGDLVAAAIKAAKLPPSVKRELTSYVAEERSDFERQLLARIERMIALEQRARRTA